MTLTEANQIWFDCYQSTDLTLWDKYTSDQRLVAIQVRSGAAFYDAEAERLDRRAAERDGWQTACWDGR